MTQCESCRRAAADCVVESSTKGHTFELCSACSRSLTDGVLSPDQWLNVASLHTGYAFELHDDFYGVYGESFETEASSTWKVRDFRADLKRLFDVVIAWNGQLDSDDGQELVAAIQRFDPAQVLAEFESRLANAKHPQVRWVLMTSAGSGILSQSAAASIASKLAPSVTPDDLSDWVQLSTGRLPWHDIRRKFFEVLQAIPAQSRRFKSTSLTDLASNIKAEHRRALMSDFLRLLPPADVPRSLAMYLELVDGVDRPGLVTDLLTDAVLSKSVEDDQQSDAKSRGSAPAWVWGQIAAACDPEWSLQFFGHQRGCWPVVSAAVEVALGRHRESVYPGIQDALKDCKAAKPQWNSIEQELKSAGRWKPW